jgi:hypothetical protein
MGTPESENNDLLASLFTEDDAVKKIRAILPEKMPSPRQIHRPHYGMAHVF